MYCCEARVRGTARIFSWFARSSRKRYQKKGLDTSQRRLVAGLEQVGIAGSSLLEIGCGVGYLHQSLLEAGAAKAVGIDISDKMIAEARGLAAERKLTYRTQYHVGDFMDLTELLNQADVSLLDKVICCYPDAQGLIARSLAKTRRVYGLVYPRNHFFNRLGAAVGAFLLRLARISFRSYVHPPEQVEAWIAAQGFHKRYEQSTPMWLTQVYVRNL